MYSWTRHLNDLKSFKPEYRERSDNMGKPEPRTEQIEKVVKFICDQKTHFTLADDDLISTATIFETRANGDVGNEEPSEIDYEEGVRLAKLVQKKFPNEFKLSVSTCDEWVSLEIEEKPSE